MDGIELRNFPQRINRFPDWLALAIYLKRSPLAPHQIFICSVTYSPQLIHYYHCNKAAVWGEESFHYSSPVFLRVSLPCAFSLIHKDEIGVGLFLSGVVPTWSLSTLWPINPCQAAFCRWTASLGVETQTPSCMHGADCPPPLALPPSGAPLLRHLTRPLSSSPLQLPTTQLNISL